MATSWRVPTVTATVLAAFRRVSFSIGQPVTASAQLDSAISSSFVFDLIAVYH